MLYTDTQKKNTHIIVKSLRSESKMAYKTDNDADSDTPVEPTASSTVKKPKKWLYEHKYQPSWKSNPKYRKWICKSKKGNAYFYCSVCICDCKGGISAAI